MKRVLATLAAFGFAFTLVLTPATPADARTVAGGGVVTGQKELCTVQTSWFERYVMQMAETKRVLCKSIK